MNLDWHHDPENGRAWAMHEDAVHRHRVNMLLYVGARVPLHVHNYPHTLMTPAGLFDVTVIPPDGPEFTREIGAPHFKPKDGCQLLVPATYEHVIVLKAMDKDVPGLAWCIAPLPQGF